MPTNTDMLRLADPTTLTIASGSVTQTQGFHILAAETGTADTLDTIVPLAFASAGTTYRQELWIIADTGDTITLGHQTGNISLPGGFAISLTSATPLKVIHNGTYWMPSYFEPAASVVLLSGQKTTDAATIAITGWTNPGWTPSEFELVVTGLETDLAAVYWDSILMTFNADATAGNYNSNYLIGAEDSATTADVVGTVAGIRAFATTAAVNSDSGVFGILTVHIRLPLGASDWKHVLYNGAVGATSNNEYVVSSGGGVWESSAAITSITLTPQGGTTFLVGGAGEPTTLDWVLKAHR
jgi:hypothetical protein